MKTKQQIKLTFEVYKCFNENIISNHYYVNQAIKILKKIGIKKLPTIYLKKDNDLKILEILEDNFGKSSLNLSQLKRKSKLDKNTISRRINKMKSFGLVNTKENDLDKKAIIVWINQKGVKLYLKWKMIYKEF